MKKIICFILTAILFCVAPAYAETEELVFEVEYFKAVKEFIAANYKLGVTEEQLLEAVTEKILKEHPEMLEEMLTAMTDSLDPYSEYMNEAEFESWMTDLSGQFVGIGVTIEERNGLVTVISPFADSPAEKAGMQANDVIASVNGEDVIGKSIEEIRALIVGESGTEVTVGVQRNGEMIELTMTRAPVTQSTVAYSIADDNIGYLSIVQFSKTTPDDVKQALDFFDENKITKIIIDIRDNPGGDRDSVVETLGYFAPKGPVLNIEYNFEELNEVFYSENENPGKYELVVLVNENSASAAEVFAGTLKDTKAATIVGERTFGKGTVQTVQALLTGGALKLTVATYTTANGTEVNKIGVSPDFEVENEVLPVYRNPDVDEIQFALMIDKNSAEEYVTPIEFRLAALGIYCGDQYDGIMDDETVEAVKQFQEKAGLPVTGAVDIDTQVALDNETRDLLSVYDRQYNKAMELLSEK